MKLYSHKNFKLFSVFTVITCLVLFSTFSIAEARQNTAKDLKKSHDDTDSAMAAKEPRPPKKSENETEGDVIIDSVPDLQLDTEDPKTADSLNPQIATDDAGHVYAAWIDMRDQNYSWDGGIRFNYSDDHGVTWQTSDVRLDSVDNAGATTGDIGVPVVACDGEDVYVVWAKRFANIQSSSSQIYFQHSENTGQAWLADEFQVSNETPLGLGTGYADIPQVCTDGNGNVYVIWRSYYEIRLRRYSSKTNTWGDITDISTYFVAPASPEIEGILDASCDDKGYVYIAWRGADDANYISRSTDFGNSWEQPQIFGNGVASASLQLACDEKGHVYAAWADDRDYDPIQDPGRLYPDDVFFNYSDDYGLTWQTQDMKINIDDPWSAENSSPQLECDDEGNVYLMWERFAYWGPGNRYTLNNIKCRISRDYALNWENEDIISGGNVLALSPKMSSDDNGHIYITHAAGAVAYLSHSLDYGNTWTAGVSISDPGPGNVRDTSISCDKVGHVYAVWRKDLSYDSIFCDASSFDVEPNLNYVADKGAFEDVLLEVTVTAVSALGALDFDWSAAGISDPTLRGIIEAEASLSLPVFDPATGETSAIFSWTPSAGSSDVYSPIVFTATEPGTAKTDSQPIAITVTVAGVQDIQEAIDAASPGATIYLNPSIYTLTEDLIIEKAITLAGVDPITTTIVLDEHHIVIRHPMLPPGAPPVDPIDVTIEGITIAGHVYTELDESYRSAPIQNHGNTLTLRDCRVVDNEGVMVSAIFSSSKEGLYLDNTLIAMNRNLATDDVRLYGGHFDYKCYSGAIYLNIGAKLYMQNSTIADNVDYSQGFLVETETGYGETGYGETGYGKSVIVEYGAIQCLQSNYLNILDSIMWYNGKTADKFPDISNVSTANQTREIANFDTRQQTIPGTGTLNNIIHEDPEFIQRYYYNYNPNPLNPNFIGLGSRLAEGIPPTEPQPPPPPPMP